MLTQMHVTLTYTCSIILCISYLYSYSYSYRVHILYIITGVEGHTVVRDLFTTEHEQQMRRRSILSGITLSEESAKIDVIVNTIGFPLVGGPAGSMEGGRQIEAAKEILQAKNVPYFVAAPLLIQGIFF